MGINDFAQHVTEATIVEKHIASRIRGRSYGLDGNIYVYRLVYQNIFGFLIRHDKASILNGSVSFISETMATGTSLVVVVDGNTCPGKVRAHSQRDNTQQKYKTMQKFTLATR